MVYGVPSNKDQSRVSGGISQLFPGFKSLWGNHETLVESIMAQHDVSKHRKPIYVGGQLRNDPPQALLDRLSLKQGSAALALITPHAEILLMPDPKAPEKPLKSRSDALTA